MAVAQQQTLFIPQVVDGGGWQTTFVLTNRTVNPATASLSFRSDTTGGATQPWTPPFLEVGSTSALVISAGSTTYLHTPGTAAVLSQGLAAVNVDAGLAVHVIFTYRKGPGDAQEGTAIASAGVTRILVPFDNSAGLITSVGLVNNTASSESISVNFKTGGGTISQASLNNIPPNGHLAFTMPQQFPSIAGQSGLAEFYTTSGTFSLLAELFTPSLSFTVSPVYLESGSPIISSPVTPSGIVTFGSGVRLVGTGIPPGRYYSAPAAGCYWERESGLGGTFADIIANDFLGSAYVQAIVDIAPTDLAFSSNGCGTWSSVPTLGAQIGIQTGTWLVGAQIAPGTYQAQAASGCYWERLRNFGGLSAAIISNHFVSSAGPQLVSIAATDVGFTTDGCGSWTRISSPQTGLVSNQSTDELTRNRDSARGNIPRGGGQP